MICDNCSEIITLVLCLGIGHISLITNYNLLIKITMVEKAPEAIPEVQSKDQPRVTKGKIHLFQTV